MRLDWDHYFIRLAHMAAERSTCDRARVGCVLVHGRHVISTGYNGSPSGMPHCDDVGHQIHNGHCIRTVHAEANAITQAACHGANTAGATAYVTHLPCMTCAQLLVSAGVLRIVFDRVYDDGNNVDFLSNSGIVVERCQSMADPMTLNEYQAEAAKTLNEGADSVYLASKLVIEAAEAAQPIIKHKYHGKILSIATVEDELGDVLWYLATLANGLGLTLEDVAQHNVAKLRERHGVNYNPEHYQPRL